MKIGIDLDGVVVDIMSPILRGYNKKFSSNYEYDDLFCHDLWEVFDLTKEESMKRVLGIIKNLHFDDVVPHEGAIESLKELSKTHELIVITSRPIFFKENTLQWIEKYLPDVFDKIAFTNQYSQDSQDKQTTKSAICAEEGVDILLEDHDFQVRDCARVCKKILVFNQPWNKNSKLPENAVRVQSWEDILEEVSN